MTLNLTNLFYSEKNIGSTLKFSKRQFIWEFDLNGSSQHIELLDSRLTQKKRLYKNGVTLLETKEEGNFIHNFEIDGHPCVIIQYGDKIELRIDNQSFTHLYNLQKNKQLFAGEKGPTSNIYISKPFNSYGSSEQKDTENKESILYKVNKPEEENKPKLFDFKIKKDTGNKSHGFNSKFKFGQNKEQSFSNKKEFNNNKNNNINNNNENNKGNLDLLGFQDQESNLNKNNNNASNNSNNLLDLSSNNNTNINNQNNQNQQKTGNDIFDLFGNNNNQNNTIQNNQNNQNDNNQFNNIFLAISDGTNQKPNFDQNNLGFLNLNNNMNNNVNNNTNINNNMNNNMNENMNMNNNMHSFYMTNNMNNFNNFQNQQMNQNPNQNNISSTQNQQNNTLNLDLLNF